MSSIEDQVWERLTVSDNQIIWRTEVSDGAIAERIDVAEFNNSIYQFPAFIPWKLYMKMAKEVEAHAAEYSKRFESKLLPQRSIDKKKIYALRTLNPDALEYFYAIISAYVFASCALESYTNSRLDSFNPTEADYTAVEQLTKM